MIKEDLNRIRTNNDTLVKEAAFKVAKYMGETEILYNLTKNYSKYDTEIKDLKKQLNNLKQDLDNKLISKEDFVKYYQAEQQAVLSINNQINYVTEDIAEKN